MVGREEQLEEVLEIIDGLEANQSSTIYIVGDAGVGKSTLVG